MKKILVSACILGEPVRYDGQGLSLESRLLKTWRDEGRIISFCPEIAAGFPTPRPPAEIEQGKDGSDVLSGSARVFEDMGKDVTACIRRGAELALHTAAANGCRFALLTDGSPSCGSTYIYDGTFNAVQKEGGGVAATILHRNGILVFNQHQIEDLARALFC